MAWIYTSIYICNCPHMHYSFQKFWDWSESSETFNGMDQNCVPLPFPSRTCIRKKRLFDDVCDRSRSICILPFESSPCIYIFLCRIAQGLMITSLKELLTVSGNCWISENDFRVWKYFIPFANKMHSAGRGWLILLALFCMLLIL